MREPAVIRWPGKIPAGKSNDEVMTTMDLLPTFAKLAGAKIPTDRVIDGKDIWPTLIGEARSPHDAFFYHRGNQLQAVQRLEGHLQAFAKDLAEVGTGEEAGDSSSHRKTSASFWTSSPT